MTPKYQFVCHDNNFLYKRLKLYTSKQFKKTYTFTPIKLYDVYHPPNHPKFSRIILLDYKIGIKKFQIDAIHFNVRNYNK